jgi:hypothetical protein
MLKGVQAARCCRRPPESGARTSRPMPEQPRDHKPPQVGEEAGRHRCVDPDGTAVGGPVAGALSIASHAGRCPVMPKPEIRIWGHPDPAGDARSGAPVVLTLGFPSHCHGRNPYRAEHKPKFNLRRSARLKLHDVTRGVCRPLPPPTHACASQPSSSPEPSHSDTRCHVPRDVVLRSVSDNLPRATRQAGSRSSRLRPHPDVIGVRRVLRTATDHVSQKARVVFPALRCQSLARHRPLSVLTIRASLLLGSLGRCRWHHG